MPSVFAFTPKFQVFDANGNFAVGYKIFTYAAGGSRVKQSTYTDSTGNSANTNPIIPNARGEVSMWLDTGLLYEILFCLDTESDPPINSIWSVDNFGVASASTINFLAAGSGATARTLQSKGRDLLHIADYGGSAGGVAATNTTALNNAIGQAAAAGKGGVAIGSGGTWALTDDTNFITRDIAIEGEGKPILDYSAGSGVGLRFDAGGSGVNVRGMTVKDFIVLGGASITSAVDIRGLVGSQLSNIEVREATTNGFNIRFAVLDTFTDLRVSNDSLAMTTSPATYFLLTDDGAAGNKCQANTFITPDASGKGALSTSTGFLLTNATGNVFVGGTAESVQNGINIAAASRVNTFIAMDLEDNVNADIIDAGNSNTYVGINSLGGGASSAIQITGGGSNFHGGSVSLVSLDSGSRDSSFHGVAFPSAAPLIGTGTYRRYGCYTVDNSGVRDGTLRDVLGPSGSAAWVGSQGGAVTQDVTLNEYKEFGALTYVQGKIAFTAAGSGGNAILIAIPAALATKASAVGMVVGTFRYDDAGTNYVGTLVVNSQVEFALYTSGSTGLFGSNPSIAIASGDNLYFSATYLSE